MHPYMPQTQADIDHMLKKIGVETIEALFSDIDPSVLLSEPLKLPDTHSEYHILNKLTQISESNINPDHWLSFAGGGIYEHLIPTIVPQLLLRSEFYTAYTPYQPEISQGTLQVIFEYQTMITELTGLEVANASHYDGATALAEAAFMACGATRKNTVLVGDTMPTEALKVLSTYLNYKGLQLVIIPSSDGIVTLSEIEANLSTDVAAYLVSTPNYYGNLENLTDVSDLLHGNKSLLITMSNPMSLSLYKSPGEWGADIAVGDGQVFGNSMNYGGPTLGFMACTKSLMRKMPGRIVGQTLDLDGKRGYVLTLQGREQHIRREKATSNITSNQALNVLAATIYLSTLGFKGIHEVAKRSHVNALYLRQELALIKDVTLVHSVEFYNEFLIQVPNVQQLMDALESYRIIPGIILHQKDNLLLIATTEVHRKEHLDSLINAFKEVLN